MGIFTNMFKSDDVAEFSIDMGVATSSSGLVRESSGSSISSTSVSITEETAMKIASLNQGISIIADTIASMPVYLYKDESGFQTYFPLDARSRALSEMANEVLTSYTLKRNLIKDLILYGNAYAKIERGKDNSCKLIYIPTSIVTPRKDNTGYYFQIQSYSTEVMGEQVPAENIDFGDMLCLVKNPKYNTVVGEGILDYATQILDTSVKETDYITNLFKNGLSAKAVLSSKTPFKKEVKEQLKSDLKEFYSGSDNAGKMMILEGDVNVIPLSLTPADIKLIENKNFTITEIARFLNIQKHLLNLDRGQGTYSNITQERLMLLQNTLSPYTVIIEEALNQKLLTEEEQKDGRYYFKFNTSEMLKLTPEDQATYMINLYKENIVTLEEVRATLNLGGNNDTIAELNKYQEVKDKQLSDSLEEGTETEKEETPKDEVKSE